MYSCNFIELCKNPTATIFYFLRFLSLSFLIFLLLYFTFIFKLCLKLYLEFLLIHFSTFHYSPLSLSWSHSLSLNSVYLTLYLLGLFPVDMFLSFLSLSYSLSFCVLVSLFLAQWVFQSICIYLFAPIYLSNLFLYLLISISLFFLSTFYIFMYLSASL